MYQETKSEKRYSDMCGATYERIVELNNDDDIDRNTNTGSGKGKVSNMQRKRLTGSSELDLRHAFRRLSLSIPVQRKDKTGQSSIRTSNMAREFVKSSQIRKNLKQNWIPVSDHPSVTFGTPVPPRGSRKHTEALGDQTEARFQDYELNPALVEIDDDGQLRFNRDGQKATLISDLKQDHLFGEDYRQGYQSAESKLGNEVLLGNEEDEEENQGRKYGLAAGLETLQRGYNTYSMAIDAEDKNKKDENE